MEQSRLKRLWQHFLHPRIRVGRYFPLADLRRMSLNIGLSEQEHQGQIRFVVESRYPASAILSGLSPRVRAYQWFGELGVWDTELNTGVLVYVSFADHAVEIVVDRGIAAKVDEGEWQSVCENMRQAFKQGAFVAGLESGLQQVDTILRQYFPRNGSDAVDELPNDVVFR